MKFIVLGKYNATGLAGFMKNPDEDRTSMISSMMDKAGGSLEAMYLTRGGYDIVAIGDAPDFDTLAAVKMLVMASGAVSEMEILEASDFGKIAAKAASLTGTYKAPGA